MTDDYTKFNGIYSSLLFIQTNFYIFFLNKLCNTEMFLGGGV